MACCHLRSAPRSQPVRTAPLATTLSRVCRIRLGIALAEAIPEQRSPIGQIAGSAGVCYPGAEHREDTGSGRVGLDVPHRLRTSGPHDDSVVIAMKWEIAGRDPDLVPVAQQKHPSRLALEDNPDFGPPPDNRMDPLHHAPD